MDEQTATMSTGDDTGEGAGGERESTLPPPVPPASRTRTPWYTIPVSRDPDDDKVGGVVAGLSKAYGFDVRMTRIAVVIATIVLPVLIVVYVVAWVLLPARPEEATSIQALVSDRRRMPLYVAIGIVLVAGGLGSFGSWFLFGGVPWGLGLIAVGVLLWAAPGFGSSRSATAPPLPPPSAPSAPGAGRGAASGIDTVPAGADALTRPMPTMSFEATPPPLPAAVARPARRGVPVGLMSFVTAVAFVGVAVGGDALDWWNISTLAVVITALLIVIAGGAVSAIVNRSWVPVTAIWILGMLVAFMSVAAPDLDGGVGERIERPTTIAGVEQRHDLAIGELTLDLTAVDLGTGIVEVDAEVGIGAIRVLVPPDARLELDIELGAGHVVVDGDELASGLRHHVERTIEPASSAEEPTTGGAGTVTIVVNARVGAGEVAIERRVVGP